MTGTSNSALAWNAASIPSTPSPNRMSMSSMSGWCFATAATTSSPRDMTAGTDNREAPAAL